MKVRLPHIVKVSTPMNLYRERFLPGSNEDGRKPLILFGLHITCYARTQAAYVGFSMKLVTPWEIHKETPLLLEHDGDLQTVAPSNKLAYLPRNCKHFDSLNDLGDPFWTPGVLATVG
jgi:hypothetical protein